MFFLTCAGTGLELGLIFKQSALSRHRQAGKRLGSADERRDDISTNKDDTGLISQSSQALLIVVEVGKIISPSQR